jgi:hypothetical protein
MLLEEPPKPRPLLAEGLEKVVAIDVAAEGVKTKVEASVSNLRERVEHAPTVRVERC